MSTTPDDATAETPDVVTTASGTQVEGPAAEIPEHEIDFLSPSTLRLLTADPETDIMLVDVVFQLSFFSFVLEFFQESFLKNRWVIQRLPYVPDFHDKRKWRTV